MSALVARLVRALRRTLRRGRPLVDVAPIVRRPSDRQDDLETATRAAPEAAITRRGRPRGQG